MNTCTRTGGGKTGTSVAISNFKISVPHFNDFSMGTTLKEDEMHTAKSLPPRHKNELFYFILASDLKIDYPPQNKIDVFHLTFTRFSLPLLTARWQAATKV